MTISDPSHMLSTVQSFTDKGRTFLVEPREQALARHAFTAEIPHTIHAPDRPVPPTAHSLARYQTPIRDQGDRGTCWAFAGAAAVEAAYRRKYNSSIVLSTQYVFHLGKVQELAFDDMSPTRSHENNSTLHGFQGSSDIVEKLQRSAVCPEADAPYLSQDLMQAVQSTIPGGATITKAPEDPSQAVMDAFELSDALIPFAARAKCRYEVAGWGRGGTPTAATLETIIAQNHEVVIDIVLDMAPDQNSVWQYDATAKGGGHVILLIGYDRQAQVFTAKNSWGGHDFVGVSYEFIEKCGLAYHYITDIRDPNAGPARRAFWMGRWTMDHDGWRGDLMIRRHTNYNDPADGPTRLGSYTRDGRTYDVNGHFEQDGQHCVLYIAPTPDRVTPGQEIGQRFDLYCFSWDGKLAAGTTTSTGGIFGAQLSRTALPAFVKNAFAPRDWIGAYAMNWDGWTGTLKITSIAPFAATLVQGTTAHAVRGTVDGHTLTLSVDVAGSKQAFTLHHHTWEVGIFSGTTVSGGRTFGVVGYLGAS